MGEYVALIDVIPEEIETDFDTLVEELAKTLPESCKIAHHEIMPVAFGLKKVRLRVRYPEEWGGTDRIEELFKQVHGLQGVEGIAFSKA